MGNFQEFFVARPKSSDELIDLKQFGKIKSKGILQVLESKCGNFVAETGFSRERVKLLQKGINVI